MKAEVEKRVDQNVVEDERMRPELGGGLVKGLGEKVTERFRVEEGEGEEGVRMYRWEEGEGRVIRASAPSHDMVA